MKNKILAIISIISLFAIMPFISAEECVGQGCGANMSLNVTNATIPIPIPQTTRTLLGQAIYEILDSSGAGLGVFMVFLGQSVPLVLLAIMCVALIIAVAYSVFYALKLWKENTR